MNWLAAFTALAIIAGFYTLFVGLWEVINDNISISTRIAFAVFVLTTCTVVGLAN